VTRITTQSLFKIEKVNTNRAKRAILVNIFDGEYEKAIKKTTDLTEEEKIELEATVDEMKETYESTLNLNEDIESTLADIKDKREELEKEIAEATKIRSDRRVKLLKVKKTV
jgi:hypothetical protein